MSYNDSKVMIVNVSILIIEFKYSNKAYVFTKRSNIDFEN